MVMDGEALKSNRKVLEGKEKMIMVDTEALKSIKLNGEALKSDGEALKGNGEALGANERHQGATEGLLIATKRC